MIDHDYAVVFKAFPRGQGISMQGLLGPCWCACLSESSFLSFVLSFIYDCKQVFSWVLSTHPIGEPGKELTRQPLLFFFFLKTFRKWLPKIWHFRVHYSEPWLVWGQFPATESKAFWAPRKESQLLGIHLGMLTNQWRLTEDHSKAN